MLIFACRKDKKPLKTTSQFHYFVVSISEMKIFRVK